MAEIPFASPVEDSVSKIDQEVAVGEDMEFQRRWWKFEKVVWSIFTILIALALSGVFGRGPAAKAHASSPNGVLSISYDRVQRTGTPSDLTVNFSQTAESDGKFHIFVSESVIHRLGTQRIAPQPESSAVGADGITYVFAAGETRGQLVFALEPSGPGLVPFQIGVPGGPDIRAKILVLP